MLLLFVVTHPFGPAPCDLSHGMRFAILTKQRLPLASNLVGKISALRAPSGCSCFFVVTHPFVPAPCHEWHGNSSQSRKQTHLPCGRWVIYFLKLIEILNNDGENVHAASHRANGISSRFLDFKRRNSHTNACLVRADAVVRGIYNAERSC